MLRVHAGLGITPPHSWVVPSNNDVVLRSHPISSRVVASYQRVSVDLPYKNEMGISTLRRPQLTDKSCELLDATGRPDTSWTSVVQNALKAMSGWQQSSEQPRGHGEAALQSQAGCELSVAAHVVTAFFAGGPVPASLSFAEAESLQLPPSSQDHAANSARTSAPATER